MKLITTITDYNHPGWVQLKRSLDHFGWDYDVIFGNYQAYGSKMINAYEYAKNSTEDYLFIVDGYDVFILDTMINAGANIYEINKNLDCIVFNTEKACWPYSQWSYLYPEVKSDWKYLNGGACFVNRLMFIKMFEENPIQHRDNDQVNLAKIYLTKGEKYNMKLDTDCKVFQSIAFESNDDFLMDNRDPIFLNTKTQSYPPIIHGNGKTNMENIYKLIH